MTNPMLTGPWFNPPVEGIITPSTLNTSIDPVFGNKFLLPNCPGADVISKLHANLQREMLHITYALTSYRSNPLDPVVTIPEPPARDQLSRSDEARTLFLLTQILTQINVTVSALPPGVNGRCVAASRRTYTSLAGTGSIIEINQNHIKDLNAAVAAGNVMLTQWLQFDIARLFVHEFGHAVAYAILPWNRGGHLFLGHGRTTEIGFEIECRLFGGLFQRETGNTLSLSGDLPFRLAQYEWPHQHTIDIYNFPVSPGAPVDMIRYIPPIPQVVPRWQVPFSYVNNFFLQDFWDRLALKQLWTTTPLKAPKIRGVLTVVAPGQPAIFLNPMDNWAGPYVPWGYIWEMDGLLHP